MSELYPASVIDFHSLSGDVYRARIKLNETSAFKFKAGQYLNLALDVDDMRPFSIASSPDELPVIELHIRQQPGNPFTEEVIHRLHQLGQIAIEGPHGHCCYPDRIEPDSSKEWVFIVGGTGFAPARSIIESSFRQLKPLHSHLFWGVGAEQDFYLKEVAETWQQQHEEFSFHPVVFNPEATWQGLIGLVHEAAIKELEKPLSDYNYFLAGSVEMVMAVYKDLQSSGVNNTQIYGDMIDILHSDTQID